MRRATIDDAGGAAGARVSIHARHATGDPEPTGEGYSLEVSIHARHATGDRR